MAEFLHVDPAFSALLTAGGLAGLDQLLVCAQGERLGKRGLESWRQRRRIELSGPGGGVQTVYLKRFVSPPLRRQIQRWLAGRWMQSTAVGEWKNCVLLAEAGVPAVRGIAVGERVSGIWERASAILLQAVEGRSLERASGEMAACGRRAHASAIEALARSVARFHRSGFVHRDLYLSHIFLLDGRDGGSPEDYVLIDLQRVFRPGWRRRRWIIKDLAALAFSSAEVAGPFSLLRFLARYVRAFPGAGETRTLARGVARRLRRMQRRRGSPAVFKASEPAGPVHEVSPRNPTAGGVLPVAAER